MEKSDILISAIVSVYNAERFLAGCLDDLENQTISSRMEIIVVDTGSPQNEGMVAKSYQKIFKNIIYIRTEQRETIYSAWNRAISVAKGKYITNANSDDRHRPDALERLVNFLENNIKYGVAYGDTFVTNIENACWPSHSNSGAFHWPKFNKKRLFGICFVGPQPVWRRSLHESHGLFADKFRSAGDYEFWLRLASSGVNFAHIPEVLGIYLASPSGMELSDKDLSHTESEAARKQHWQQKLGPIKRYPQTFFFEALPLSPLVTVVIPTFNRPTLLKDALTSLITQTYQNWEAIVVNDGGENIQAQILAVGNDSRIFSITHWKSFGQSTARNVALRAAKGQIICYLDDDDKFLPHHIQGIVSEFQSSPCPFIYTGAIKITEQIIGEQRLEVDRIGIEDKLKTPHEKLFAWNFIPLPTWAHRRECLNHVGFFDDSMTSHEDWDFLLRFAELWPLRHLDQESVEIRVRRNAIDSVTTRNNALKAKVFREIYHKHPTISSDIQNLRRSVLANLGQQETSTLMKLLEKYTAYYNRHIGWRIPKKNKI